MSNLTMEMLGGLKKRLIDNGDGTYAELVAIEAVGPVGSTGHDFSTNAPTLPHVGADFAASGPYASYVLVQTVPANASRNFIDVENLSGGPIAVIRDDGTAGVGAAPLSASVFAISGGAAAGQQGGSFSSTTFRGRYQIYAPAHLSGSAFITIMED